MEVIQIHKGDCTIFADCKKFLTFYIDTELDLTGWSAKFILGYITKEFSNITSKSFEVVLSAQETSQLRYGFANGAVILMDGEGNTKTVINTIPFEITSKVVENVYQEIDLTIPETSGLDIKLKVGASTVTSVNGMTGDVVIDIPSDLSEYVKNTDYATAAKAGIIKATGAYGLQTNPSNGVIYGKDFDLTKYQTSSNLLVISKGTLDNVLTQYKKVSDPMTEEAYNALETKDSNTLYLIEE